MNPQDPDVIGLLDAIVQVSGCSREEAERIAGITAIALFRHTDADVAKGLSRASSILVTMTKTVRELTGQEPVDPPLAARPHQQDQQRQVQQQQSPDQQQQQQQRPGQQQQQQQSQQQQVQQQQRQQQTEGGLPSFSVHGSGGGRND